MWSTMHPLPGHVPDRPVHHRGRHPRKYWRGTRQLLQNENGTKSDICVPKYLTVRYEFYLTILLNVLKSLNNAFTFFSKMWTGQIKSWIFICQNFINCFLLFQDFCVFWWEIIDDVVQMFTYYTSDCTCDKRDSTFPTDTLQNRTYS